MVWSRRQQLFATLTKGIDSMSGIQQLDAKGRAMLMLGMIVLGLITFAAMVGFVTLCDRV